MKFSALAILALGTFSATKAAASPPESKIKKSWVIGKVPAAFPVGFGLHTDGNRQYVAYYDETRQMTVTARTLGSDDWQYHRLPSHIQWDSHNYVTLATDQDGHLHVSGNMHNVPLVYFRTRKPGDVSTLERAGMTGANEASVTYPRFFKDDDGHLVFTYRDGGSGRGRQIINRYDAVTREWSRLLDDPILDGEGKRSAYPHPITKGPDGFYHLVWVWRDTPDCATNHHLSHARSMDLVHWESAAGEQVALPIRLSDERLWVDPIPSGGGIINGCEKLTFDRDRRPIITYHKSDAEGNMQIYAARFENGKWTHRALSDWDTPIQFGGGGSMAFIGISISGLKPVEPGVMALSYRHRDDGSGILTVSEETLKPLKRKVSSISDLPPALREVRSKFPGMEIRRSNDTGNPSASDTRYLLQWETLGANRDLPREPPLPEPSELILYQLLGDGSTER